MATLGDLVVNLGMNSQKFNRGIDGAKSKLSKFAGFAKGAIVAGLGAGVAAAGVVAAKTMAQMGPLDEMAKTADKLGIAANKMGGLQLAFEQTGVSAEAGFLGIQRLTRGVSEAAQGTGTAKDALLELGLNAAQLNKLSPEQMLNQVADAMQGVSGQADKVRIAYDLFGRSGVDLVNTVKGGSASLEAFQATADKLNMNHTREELASIEAANDAMNRASKAVTGAFQQIAIVAAPVLETLANKLTGLTASFGGMKTQVNGVVKSIGDGWTWLQDTITEGFLYITTVGGFAFDNFGKIAQLAFKTAQLGAVVFFNDVAFFFTDKLPAYLSWFADNWRDVFMTAIDFVGTGFLNFGENIKNNWTAVLDFITGSSSKLNLTWKPLTEGFKSSIKELPDIPERKMTQLEQQLTTDARMIGDQLGEDLSSRLKNAFATLDEMRAGEAARQTAVTAPGAATGADGGAGARGAGGPGIAKAMVRGSGEAFKAILTAQQKKKDPNLAENKKQTKILEKQLDIAREQVKEPTFQVAVAAGF